MNGPATPRRAARMRCLAAAGMGLISAALFVGLAFRHTWFRDEAQILLMASESASLGELLGWIRYEGTTGLFHAMVWVLCRLGLGTPAAVTAFYGLWLAAYVGVICFGLRIPLAGRLALLLLPCSIYYADNVRQYLLGAVFLLAVAGVALRRGVSRPGPALLLLAGAAQISLHYALGVGLIGMVFQGRGIRRWRALDFVGAGVCALSLGTVLVQVVPPADLMPGLRGWDPQGRAYADVFASVAASALFGGWVVPWVILGAFSVLVWHARRQWPAGALLALVAALAGFAGFAAVGYWKYSEDRHHWALGFQMVVLLCILAGETGLPALPRAARIAFWWVPVLALAPGFVESAQRVLHREKSASRRAAEFLDREFGGRPMIGSVEFFLAPIVVYRGGGAAFFALERGAWVRHTVWNHPSVDYRATPRVSWVRMSRVLDQLDALPDAVSAARPVLVLAGNAVENDAPDRADGAGFRTRKWRVVRRAGFRGAEWENYQVFELIPEN